MMRMEKPSLRKFSTSATSIMMTFTPTWILLNQKPSLFNRLQTIQMVGFLAINLYNTLTLTHHPTAGNFLPETQEPGPAPPDTHVIDATTINQEPAPMGAKRRTTNKNQSKKAVTTDPATPLLPPIIPITAVNAPRATRSRTKTSIALSDPQAPVPDVVKAPANRRLKKL